MLFPLDFSSVKFLSSSRTHVQPTYLYTVLSGVVDCLLFSAERNMLLEMSAGNNHRAVLTLLWARLLHSHPTPDITAAATECA